jgi:hypothetical protein
MRTTLTCEYIFYVTLLYSNALGDLIFSKSLIGKDEVKESVSYWKTVLGNMDIGRGQAAYLSFYVT